MSCIAARMPSRLALFGSTTRNNDAAPIKHPDRFADRQVKLIAKNYIRRRR